MIGRNVLDVAKITSDVFDHHTISAHVEDGGLPRPVFGKLFEIVGDAAFEAFFSRAIRDGVNDFDAVFFEDAFEENVLFSAAAEEQERPGRRLVAKLLGSDHRFERRDAGSGGDEADILIGLQLQSKIAVRRGGAKFVTDIELGEKVGADTVRNDLDANFVFALAARGKRIDAAGAGFEGALDDDAEKLAWEIAELLEGSNPKVKTEGVSHSFLTTRQTTSLAPGTL